MAKMLGSRPSAESSNLSILTYTHSFAMMAESGWRHSPWERKYVSTRGSNPLHGVFILKKIWFQLNFKRKIRIFKILKKEMNSIKILKKN